MYTFSIFFFQAFGFRKSYFTSHWNQFDLFIIVVSIVDIALDLTILSNTEASSWFDPGTLRIIKVFRLMRSLRLLKVQYRYLIPAAVDRTSASV